MTVWENPVLENDVFSFKIVKICPITFLDVPFVTQHYDLPKILGFLNLKR